MAAKKLATYCNPFWDGSLPDPFVLKVRGRYYTYGTEPERHPSIGSKVFPILTSTDLIQWREIGKAMPALGQEYFSYWAPEVTVYNGQFLLYYAVHTEEFRGGIRVAVADRPEGPFLDSGRDLTSHLLPWAIDPHIFRNQDGLWYLYMTVEYWNDPDGFTGSGNAVDRLIDPFTLEGKITRVTPPGQAWQLFEAKRQARGGVDWYTVEGPAVVRHRRRYYEMYSGGCYYRDNYAVSYAISDTPMGPDGMRDTSWHDWEGIQGNPILIRGDHEHLVSPGHNSLVLGPNNADMYIVYHAWLPDMRARRPCLDRLFWHGDMMWTAAPTYTPQPAPILPRMREFFEEPALQASWQQQGGHWRISPGEVLQEDHGVAYAALQHQEALSTAWLLEVNLRHVAGNGSCGVLLQSNAGTTVRIAITPDSRLVIWKSSEGPLGTMSLPDDVVIESWHQLIISYSGSLLRVQFDYLQPLEVAVEAPARTFALITEHCSAAFSGISLTDHFRDEFLNDERTPALLGWSVEVGNDSAVRDTSLADWSVRGGTLEQVSAERGEHIVLKGPSHEQYEFGATMMLREANEQGQPALGIALWHSVEEKLVIWLVQDQLHWRLLVESRAAGVPARGASTGSGGLDLPEAFNPFTWHTLRLTRWGDRLTIYLDGPEALTVNVPARPERVGLITYDAAAAFMDVWQTGWSAE